MKIIKNIFLSILTLFILSSCEDAYNIDEPGALTNEATFKTVNDLQTYLNGIYSSGSNLNEVLFTSLFTDEVAPPSTYNGEYRDLHRFTLNSATGLPSAIWSNNYYTINRVNRLIEGSELITMDDSEADQFYDILAQARVLRANAYLQLQSFFSPDMTDPNGLGAIILEGVPPSDVQAERSTNAEVFALIEDDLIFALNNLESGQGIYKPSKGAAEALLARMYLYSGNHSMAATYANNVISNYNFDLAPAGTFDASTFYTEDTESPYRKVWADLEDVGEEIFTLKSESTGVGFSVGSLFFFNSSSFFGQPKWAMGIKLFEKLAEVDGDIRRYAFVDPSSNPGENRIYIDKYPGIPSAPLRNDVKLVRISEMHFILAEVAAANQSFGEVSAHIQHILDARNTGIAPNAPSISSTSEAYGVILDERRKEFAFEGMRYIDLRRLGAMGNRSIDRSDLDDELSGMPLTLDINDYRFTLPIPLDEINGNTLVTQNPGY